jgi:hypothetical protein
VLRQLTFSKICRMPACIAKDGGAVVADGAAVAADEEQQRREKQQGSKGRGEQTRKHIQ